MKRTFLLLTAFLLSISTFAQTTLSEYTFEAQEVNSKVENIDGWATWNPGSSPSAIISDAQNHTEGGAKSMFLKKDDDMVFYTTNLKTGNYQFDFWVFVPTDKEAYVNIQHDFGKNWAFEMFFTKGGKGKVNWTEKKPTDEPNKKFDFAHDQWLHVVFDLNLNEDKTVINLNDEELCNFPFKSSASGPTASNPEQLAALNFYAAEGNEFYVDDFKYIEVVPAEKGAELALSATEFSGNGTSNETLTISNLGKEELSFETSVVYDIKETTVEEGKEPIPVTYFKVEEGVAPASLAYNGENLTIHTLSVFKYAGFGNGPALKDYIGMRIAGIAATANPVEGLGKMTLKLYEGGNILKTGPANNTPLVSIEKTPNPQNGQTLVLAQEFDAPIYITGKDLFAGCTVVQKEKDKGVLLTSGANNIKGANLIRLDNGVAWLDLAEGSTEDHGNLANVIFLEGTPIFQWLTLDKTAGKVAEGGQENVTLKFNLSGIKESGEYKATVVVKTNDQTDNEEYVEVPVTINVTVSATNDMEKTAIMTYPNPAYDFLNVKSDSEIKEIKIHDTTGRLVSQSNTSAKVVSLPISNLNAGIYFVTIKTNSQEITKKFIVK